MDHGPYLYFMFLQQYIPLTLLEVALGIRNNISYKNNIKRTRHMLNNKALYAQVQVTNSKVFPSLSQLALIE